jgi:putative membrane protein
VERFAFSVFSSLCFKTFLFCQALRIKFYIKIAGLVPFTIPLSWFYLGFSAYLIARAALASRQLPNFLAVTGAIGLGSLFLTSWDLVLDPAMSQTTLPFWMWEQPGAFFGMPYQNFAGWLGTGALFMSAATWIWSAKPLTLPRKQLERRRDSPHPQRERGGEE